jgi:hypothetical protein
MHILREIIDRLMISLSSMIKVVPMEMQIENQILHVKNPRSENTRQSRLVKIQNEAGCPMDMCFNRCVWQNNEDKARITEIGTMLL